MLELNEDSIYLIRRAYKSHIRISGLKKIPTENIEAIKLKRKSGASKGALIGAGVGLAAVLVIYTQEDRTNIGPPYPSQTLLLPLPILGMIPGALIGFVSSNIRIFL